MNTVNTSLLDWAFDIPELTEIERFQITGRGTVIIVKAVPRLVFDHKIKVNNDVFIGGKRYRIGGIEMTANYASNYERAARNGAIALQVNQYNEETGELIPSYPPPSA